MVQAANAKSAHKRHLVLPCSGFEINLAHTLAVLCVVLGPFLGRAADLPLVTWQGQTMGSTYTVKIVDAPLKEKQVASLKAEIEQRLKEVSRQLSHYQPDSE